MSVNKRHLRQIKNKKCGLARKKIFEESSVANVNRDMMVNVKDIDARNESNTFTAFN